MKKKVGILYGGKSAEHEISILSAQNVFDAIDKSKFVPVMIKIEKSGQWQMDAVNQFDVIFPILHGPFGEDGTIQGYLKLADKPFVGPDVLGSAVGMDKDVMKRLFRDAGIPIGKFLTLRSHEKVPSFSEVKAVLACGATAAPVFIKPANMGSSVGISKVSGESEYLAALKEAFQYDTKIVMEEFIPGREIECAVLGNEEPVASVPGEITPSHDFYSYDAKYIDNKGASLQIPAKLDEETTKRIQELAIKVYKTLCCEGLSRVDFFLKTDSSAPDNIIVNEINTMPGFTKISMYPKMWEAAGVNYTDLITRLIDLSVSRFERDKQLRTSR
ncbi:MAG: D-alanine--D-alanine ligase [Treponema sp.]|nr:D-alanine--D-alanine ligase [Treponema sp.]